MRDVDDDVRLRAGSIKGAEWMFESYVFGGVDLDIAPIIWDRWIEILSTLFLIYF